MADRARESSRAAQPRRGEDPNPEPIIRVIARDIELGDVGVRDLRPGQFVVVCAEPLHVAQEQRFDDGTVLLTLKLRTVEEGKP
ncbi:hypothetical protein [Mangrovihabitans endophyticus]|uniref:Uncharacterized protein n=1 Tax=Mangrovihabitans endophyticus TaxID=1751298 RepID=A0A8J3FNS0_9ACTN|nr:hypothetical protein [Mangrovihabitans endophyticus]GGK89398.1 hypothetical protein GCM10012284_24200 [Mangrovihabitans endophyticus]